MVDDTRSAPRHRTLKGGSVSFDGGGCECTVRNLSFTGAHLEIENENPIKLPDFFTLIIRPEYLKRDCQVIWRKGKSIGIRFV